MSNSTHKWLLRTVQRSLFNQHTPICHDGCLLKQTRKLTSRRCFYLCSCGDPAELLYSIITTGATWHPYFSGLAN